MKTYRYRITDGSVEEVMKRVGDAIKRGHRLVGIYEQQKTGRQFTLMQSSKKKGFKQTLDSHFIENKIMAVMEWERTI